MKIANNLTELIGNTPLVRLNIFEQKEQSKANIIAKVEAFNPLSSVKDRAAFALITDAEQRGLLTENSIIIEPTSGNMGIGLSFVALTRGYKVILTMPETMSIERRKLLAALGAEIRLTEGKKGMKGAIELAKDLVETTENAFMPSQFENEANFKAHQNTTAEEIWADTDGTVDIFVAGVGTGGTISGVGLGLKSHNPNVKIIAVEPKESAVLSGENAGPHGIQGIGAGFIPSIVKREIIDEVVKIETAEAIKYAKLVAKTEGLLVGISSGAALCAAAKLALLEENRDKKIVVLLPDTGERYISTALFE